MTPTARSLRWLRSLGWWVDCTERQTGPIKRDWHGFADLIGYQPETCEWGLFQVTTATHFADRIRKVYANRWARELTKRKACLVEIHGWKAKGNVPAVRRMLYAEVV